MGNEMKLLVRTFSNVEPQKLRLGLLAGCFVVSLTYFSMTNSFVVPLPTINSRPFSNHADPISTLLGEITMSSSIAGTRENGTNALDSKLDLSKKVDIMIIEKNFTTRTEPPLLERQDVKGSQTIENNKKTETSPLKNDERSVVYQATSPGGQDANSTQISGFDANMERSQKRVDDLVPRSHQDDEIHADVKVVVKSIIAAVNSTQKFESSDFKQLDIINVHPNRKPMCDLTDKRCDVCEFEGDIRINGKQSTIVLITPEPTNQSWQIRPYPRKPDEAAMKNVRTIFLHSTAVKDNGAPLCDVNHHVPAIVFSDHGYTGNFFHDFTDVMVPLFQTARQFNGEVEFLVTDYRSWWINKYLPIFKKLSNYELINFDNDQRVHCFPRAIVGLKAHKDLAIDPWRAPNGYSMVDFAQFMRNSYSLERNTIIRNVKKPRLLLIARGKTRRFLNLDKIVGVAAKIGFEVVVAENGGDEKIGDFARIVNSCDVMMGVHGAGLTNLVFLPRNAILIQILPWGRLEWIAGTYFKEPAKAMDLRYLEYSIGMNESSLIEKYPREHPVFTDPMSIHRLGWVAMGDIYLRQNVKLNVRRFKRVLSRAMKQLRQ